MTESYTFTFKVEPAMFRRALYFNTFAKQRAQVFIVAAMWLLGAGLFVANIVFSVPMTSVMQLCYIVLLVALPLLVFSCEHGYRQYRDSELSGKTRMISLSDDWLKFRVGGSPESEKVEWRQIACVFELDDMLIIYRDANLMVLLPKSAVSESELTAIRKIMFRQLGRAFFARPGRFATVIPA